MTRPGFIWIPTFLALILLGGCGHYQMGVPSAPLTFDSIHIAPVKMRALIPQAQPIVDRSVRQAFSRDGRLALANDPATAGAILQITITGYHRETATSRMDDTGLARKFEVTLDAEATLVDRSGRTRFLRRPLEVKRDVYTDSGQIQSEYQILPLLAQDLSARAVHAVLDTW